jgi:hypothetical protein
MLSIAKSFVFPLRTSRAHKRSTLAWGAALTLLAGFGSVTARIIRRALTRHDDGMLIHLDAAELDTSDAEILELSASDLVWVREKSVPPPLPPGVSARRRLNLAPPDVHAFELH